VRRLRHSAGPRASFGTAMNKPGSGGEEWHDTGRAADRSSGARPAPADGKSKGKEIPLLATFNI